MVVVRPTSQKSNLLQFIKLILNASDISTDKKADLTLVKSLSGIFKKQIQNINSQFGVKNYPKDVTFIFTAHLLTPLLPSI